jgi:hypothetical protein
VLDVEGTVQKQMGSWLEKKDNEGGVRKRRKGMTGSVSDMIDKDMREMEVEDEIDEDGNE